MSLKLSAPQSGKVGPVVNVITKYGQVERLRTIPRNPQSLEQQQVRGNFGVVTGRWGRLTAEQREAWRTAALDSYTTTRLGRQVPLSAYNYFCRINFCRMDLGLSTFELPPIVPGFAPNYVEELLITNDGRSIALKLRVPRSPAQYTVLQASAPCSPGVSCVQHFPSLGFLPPPVDGWSDITELYVNRFSLPPVGRAVWVRTRQHIDGWNDLPKTTHAIVPAPSP